MPDTTSTDETTDTERILDTTANLTQFRAADWVADNANVDEKTAENHLTILAKHRLIDAKEEDGKTLYRPNPIHSRLESIQQILRENTEESLYHEIAMIEKEISDTKETFEVATPGDLEDDEGQNPYDYATKRLGMAQHWQMMEYRRRLIEDTLVVLSA